ncbi:hypothetical protein EJ110_NYTH33626 [Nymphaea thermarum]|nr:hypothetical protein EJ110_NYTH33626 [Nymphaea thermarum]
MRGNMVKAEEDAEELKSRLVKEICLISSRSCSCSRPRSFPGKSEFVDWYRLLCVCFHHPLNFYFCYIEEDAEIDVIRKRYHQLGRTPEQGTSFLNIHPDKNTHPNAGVAFKLVSEHNGGAWIFFFSCILATTCTYAYVSANCDVSCANCLFQAYECLSNTTKRAEFNLERTNRICSRCQRSRPSEACGTFDKVRKEKVSGAEFSSRRARQEKARREMKQAIKEEAIVIASSISICHQAPRNESPIFDPAMYSLGYPHRRTPLECSGLLDSRRQQNDIYASKRCNGGRNHQRKAEFPVFENCNRISCISPNRTKHTVLKV